MLRWRTILGLAPLLLAVELGAAQDQPPRWQFAGAFVHRDSATVRRLLTPDALVWPPSPDTARRGAPAIAYLQQLALSSKVTRSEFRPRSLRPDGPYLLEQGIWVMTIGRSRVSARYDLSWRQVGGRWRVSFLRWDLFR